MTITRVGSNEKYASGWERAFGKNVKKASKLSATAKATPAKKASKAAATGKSASLKVAAQAGKGATAVKKSAAKKASPKKAAAKKAKK